MTLLPEWAPQSGILLTWPPPESDFSPWMAAVEANFARITHAILAQGEAVLIICQSPIHRQQILNTLAPLDNPAQLHFEIIPANDCWARDHGPITLRDTATQQLQLLDFIFDGWGGQFDATLDNQINAHLAQHSRFFQRLSWVKEDLVLEGGGIETDGQGTLLTTQCVLAHNPTRSPAEITQHLQRALGVNRVIWLNGQLPGDDTGGHIDTLARFCDPHTILYVEHPALGLLKEQLTALRTLAGEPYRLLPLPAPQPRWNAQQQPLPATYANFLILNQAVLVPTYQDPADAQALTQIAQGFPTRQIIPIDCTALIEQYGSLHCVTMQLPQGIII